MNEMTRVGAERDEVGRVEFEFRSLMVWLDMMNLEVVAPAARGALRLFL